MADIYNLGTSGAALNATTTGLTYLAGPAVWFPGTPGNELTSPGFTIPSTAGVLPLPFTDGTLTITAALASFLPMAAARSLPVAPSSRTRGDPSGSCTDICAIVLGA